MAYHNELGKEGERIAAEYLRHKDYRILESNWRFERFEVDIIARKDGFLVFAEVKSRQTDAFGHPATFVKRSQQQHLAEAVEAYLYLHPELMSLQIRYDVLSVLINRFRRSTEHIEDAFWPDNLRVFSAD